MEKAVFGQVGKQVLIEQFLDGEELTIMAFTDGRTIAPMLPAQDHKRVGDGDTGLNTGGMGAYCPAPLGTQALREQVAREILQPIVETMSRLGCPFQGVLYAGLMVELAPTGELFRHPGHPYPVGLLNSVPLLDFSHPPGEILSAIEGHLPAELPPGCLFRDRCPLAHDRCREEPPWVKVSPGHQVRCWNYA